MRIYDGSPRQDFEEVFRSIGAYLDRRGMKEMLLAEAPDGFIVQGLVLVGGGTWSDTIGQQSKETLTFLDDDISRFMEEGVARRNSRLTASAHVAGYYELALRVIGRYMDEQKPRDVFFFEQDGNFVVRMLRSSQVGSRHVLFEFTAEDVKKMIAEAPNRRGRDAARSGASPGRGA
ncbi:MAG: hypothetical protein FJ038_00445 [Chloroflexi bacterium]|nr:hypothetical protein [Chloroflexota bacterium]